MGYLLKMVDLSMAMLNNQMIYQQKCFFDWEVPIDTHNQLRYHPIFNIHGSSSSVVSLSCVFLLMKGPDYQTTRLTTTADRGRYDTWMVFEWGKPW
jgi:hypothetical protein